MKSRMGRKFSKIENLWPRDDSCSHAFTLFAIFFLALTLLLINSVFATSSGKVVINEKTYNMEDAERFIEQMIEIMN